MRYTVRNIMKTYRHIIWDWNGTLFDDAWLCVEIINGLLAKRGLPLVDSESYQAQFTFPVKEYYRRLGFDFAQEPFEVLAAEFVAAYDERRFECRLQPGAREVLQALERRGVAQSILSAYEQTRLVEIVRFTGIHTHFAALIGISDFYAGSKVEQGTAMICQLDCAPAEVALIGDTLHDHEVASAMGIDCYLIPSGHHGPDTLRQCGAYILAGVDEVGMLGRVSGASRLGTG